MLRAQIVDYQANNLCTCTDFGRHILTSKVDPRTDRFNFLLLSHLIEIFIHLKGPLGMRHFQCCQF